MNEQSGGKSRLSTHVPFGLVLLIAAIGFLLVAMQHWRRGTVLLAVALLVAAGMRAVIPQERTGLLTIRSRVVDVLLYSGFAVVILAVALTIKR
ncbi:Protein of unknown function [Saccharopolyspora antimicrobica]|uniref:DUF3017 domain-containing protein n=2 Tax=Saccharopolyspora TaxID=1835 RepID=A0A1I5D5T6_9PSEU|nr:MULTISPECIES: DUF3017 domain-containing protein [Saccharopolyspora]RKT85242.1 Protein of unknown function (DUF3017) [Saccharopolyspora antimicrobica]SEG95033.1 Protein of unknown function [Saccharopolyspora kobensis]SFD60840.1 Protein of unknown function [Saccharopolyspora kobensis]SFN94201.1 Protein of unknown function [Saccharopolyspora antimicrobica]